MHQPFVCVFVQKCTRSMLSYSITAAVLLPADCAVMCCDALPMLPMLMLLILVDVLLMLVGC